MTVMLEDIIIPYPKTHLHACAVKRTLRPRALPSMLLLLAPREPLHAKSAKPNIKDRIKRTSFHKVP